MIAVSCKPVGALWLGYCGALGYSYDLECVIAALRMINDKGMKAPRLLVMGDGPKRKQFEDCAEAAAVDAVFTGSLPYPLMCALLSACDMVVNPIVKGAAQSIINKHADYVASGLPVINTQEGQEYRDLVDEYEMGFNCRVGDAGDVAEKIIALISDEALRTTMGENARRCAEERFDRRAVYPELMDVVFGRERRG